MLRHKLEQVENFMMQHLKIKNYSNGKKSGEEKCLEEGEKKEVEQME